MPTIPGDPDELIYKSGASIGVTDKIGGLPADGSIRLDD
jgi:hypothetical protein